MWVSTSRDARIQATGGGGGRSLGLDATQLTWRHPWGRVRGIWVWEAGLLPLVVGWHLRTVLDSMVTVCMAGSCAGG